MNEIAKQHNNLIDLPLRKFNASEMDILLAICYKCQEQGNNAVVLSFHQLRQLAHYKNKNKSQFVDDIIETNKKLMALNFMDRTENKIVQFVLFPTFEISLEYETLTVDVHERFAYLLNRLTENYTSLELQQSASLKSSYSKAIYKKLRKFKATGVWIVSINNFREYLDIPEGYSVSKIDQRVIFPAIAELNKFFVGLRYEKKYEKYGRGRPAVSGYKFTFKADKSKEKKALSQETIAKLIPDWEKTARYCPKCKRIMYSKHIENENGSYTMYGHTDWRTGECNYTTNDYADLLEEFKITGSEYVSSDQQLANKRKLKNIFGKLFSQD